MGKIEVSDNFLGERGGGAEVANSKHEVEQIQGRDIAFVSDWRAKSREC